MDGKLTVRNISTHDNPVDMMITSVSVAKFEIFSEYNCFNLNPSGCFGSESIFVVVQGEGSSFMRTQIQLKAMQTRG